MDQLAGRADWEAKLPQAMNWLTRVNLESVSKTLKGKWHVVFCEIKSGKLGIDPKVMKSLPEKFHDVVKSAGILQSKEGGRFWIEEMGYVVVPICSQEATPAQISRQAGIDAAAMLRNMDEDEILLTAHEKLVLSDLVGGVLIGYDDGAQFRKNQSVRPFPHCLRLLDCSISDQVWSEQLAMARSSVLTRWLQNLPANWLNPTRFGDIAQTLCRGEGVNCQIFGAEELKEKGMGAFLSVAAGALNPPCMISIEIAGTDSSLDDAPAVLVGKGVTFDAGGINMKPSEGLEEMKFDMSGGAAVLGAAFYLQHQKPQRRTVCLIGAVENMPSGEATRPGDIVKSMSGITIEVNNTDAEGRLVLADVLTYAQSQYRPFFIADIATLTGAVLHGLGHAGAAFLTPDQELARYIEEQTIALGEPVWRLPLWPELYKEVEGNQADLKNIPASNVKAGTIVGGIFLSRFIEGVPWVHLDIAGAAWSCAATGYLKSGGSGFGLRMLTALTNWKQNNR